MAKVYRFRVTSEVGSSRLAVGPKEYASGQEFTLTSDQAKRFVNAQMLENKYLVVVEELGGDEPQKWDATAQKYVEGKAGQTLDRFGELFDAELRTVYLRPTLVADDVVDKNDAARYYPDEDCVFESIQLPEITLANLAANNYRVQVSKVPNGTDTATEVLEYAGTANNKAEHCAVGASGSTPTNYTIAANGPNASGTVDFGLAASNVEWVYVGFYDKFDGIYVDVDTANDAAATATVEYAKVTDSGTISWTTVNGLVDGTVSGDLSLAQDGAIYWNRPGDWGKTTIGSEASGAADLYYVRIGDSTNVAFKSTADAHELWLLSRQLRPKDNDVFFEKGDMLRIDSKLAATGSIAGSNYTGAVGLSISLRKAR